MCEMQLATHTQVNRCSIKLSVDYGEQEATPE